MTGKRTLPLALLTLLLLASTATAQAQSTTEIIYVVIVVIAIASILHTYHLTQAKNGLENRLRTLKAILDKQRAEIDENEEKLAIQRAEIAKMIDGKVINEAKKAEQLKKSKKSSIDTLRMEYWDRLGQLEEPSPKKTEIEKLLNEKKEIEGLVEATKSKYVTEVIDKGTFNEIMGGYQKKLIELESRLAKLNEEKPK
ncbi:MAG: hypothetical protein NTU61_05490 [Candidatus Altiarchaeota archaeon]|nr:hypothetical protein [Candidatus Altiarchaeota archaeon]